MHLDMHERPRLLTRGRRVARDRQQRDYPGETERRHLRLPGDRLGPGGRTGAPQQIEHLGARSDLPVEGFQHGERQRVLREVCGQRERVEVAGAGNRLNQSGQLVGSVGGVVEGGELVRRGER